MVESRTEKLFNIFNIIIMLGVLLAVGLPIIYIVMNSFVSIDEFTKRSVVIIPSKLDITAYKAVLLGSSDIINGYSVTLFRAIIGTSANMLFSCFLAYSLSRKDFPCRKGITLYMFITMLFGGGLIPYYIVASVTGMRNNLLVFIIPGLVSVWNVFLLRNFMMEIPESINESAEIDGASQAVILFKLIIPLSVPSLVTISLFYAVAHWNNWFDAYLFMTDQKKFPLQLVLRNILVTSQLNLSDISGTQFEEIVGTVRPPARSIQNAAVVVSTLPIICVYPFIQKYFVKGIMVGAIKG